MVFEARFAPLARLEVYAMKRLTALVLALMMLLTWTVACAESSGTQIMLRKMRVYNGENEDDYVSLHDMRLYLSAGSAEGIPTLQILLDYGDEQETESVLQVVGSKLVVCIGGINGTYYVDLNDVYEEPGKGLLTATAFGAAIQMFGADPDSVIKATMPKDEKKYRTLRFELPVQKIHEALERYTGEQESNDEVQKTGLMETLESFAQSDEPVEMMIRYRKSKKRFQLYFINGDEKIWLTARTQQTTGPMEFINPSADEEQRNLLELDQEMKDELAGELEFLGIKITSFLLHSSLKNL